MSVCRNVRLVLKKTKEVKKQIPVLLAIVVLFEQYSPIKLRSLNCKCVYICVCVCVCVLCVMCCVYYIYVLCVCTV